MGLVDVLVTRTDPTHQCENGLCYNGPNQAWGFTYFLTLTTYQTASVPTSPTRPFAPRFDQANAVLNAEVVESESNVYCLLPTSLCTVYMVPNIEQTMAPRLPLIPSPYNTSSPVTLPYGGAGGANGGVGGRGHAKHPPFPVVLDNVVSDLVAGSNGATGGEIPQETLSLDWDCGVGGMGGGAIELIAVNDLIIGPHGGISVDGSDGDSAYRGGGGGSGGTVLLSAGGVLVIQSNVTARGGTGGDGLTLGGRGGGGGGGGRIAGYAQSLNVLDGAGFDASGGYGGTDQPRKPDPPLPYIGQIEVYYPFLGFYNGLERNASNIDGADGVVQLMTAGGAQYRVELDVREGCMCVYICMCVCASPCVCVCAYACACQRGSSAPHYAFRQS